MLELNILEKKILIIKNSGIPELKTKKINLSLFSIEGVWKKIETKEYEYEEYARGLLSFDLPVIKIELESEETKKYPIFNNKKFIDIFYPFYDAKYGNLIFMDMEDLDHFLIKKFAIQFSLVDYIILDKKKTEFANYHNSDKHYLKKKIYNWDIRDWKKEEVYNYIKKAVSKSNPETKHLFIKDLDDYCKKICGIPAGQTM